eukprot:459564_1
MTFNQQKSKKVEFHQQHATISTNSYNCCTDTNKHHPTTKSSKFRINRFIETHFKPNLHGLEFNRRTSILQRVIGNSCGTMYNVIDIKRELLVSTQYQPLGITLDRALDQFKARKRAPEHAAKYEEQEWSMANTRQLRRSYGDYNDKNRFHGDYNNGGDNSGNSRDRFESCDSGTGSGTGNGGRKDKRHSGYYIHGTDGSGYRDRVDNGGGRRDYMSRCSNGSDRRDYIHVGGYRDRVDNGGGRRDYMSRCSNGSDRRDYIHVGGYRDRVDNGSSRRDYIDRVDRRDYGDRVDNGSDTRDKDKANFDVFLVSAERAFIGLSDYKFGGEKIRIVFCGEKLTITNIPRNYDEKDIIELFSRYGIIIDCRVLLDTNGKGVAFVRWMIIVLQINCLD